MQPMVQKPETEVVTPLQRALIQAITGLTEQQMRGVLAAAVAEKMGQYDCQRVIAAAMDPIVSLLVRDMLKDQSIVDMIQARARQQLIELVGKMNLTTRY